MSSGGGAAALDHEGAVGKEAKEEADTVASERDTGRTAEVPAANFWSGGADGGGVGPN